MSEICQCCDNYQNLRQQLAASEEARKRWEEEARQYCQNSDYWRQRAEAAEAALAKIKNVAACETAENFLKCDDETKKAYFAMMVADSAEVKRLREELAKLQRMLGKSEFDFEEASRQLSERNAEICDLVKEKTELERKLAEYVEAHKLQSEIVQKAIAQAKAEQREEDAVLIERGCVDWPLGKKIAEAIRKGG